MSLSLYINSSTVTPNMVIPKPKATVANKTRISTPCWLMESNSFGASPDLDNAYSIRVEENKLELAAVNTKIQK